jgi:general secretion pathway protein D
VRAAVRRQSGIALPSNPLGDQPVTLNFVDADIQAVVRALSRSTGQQFLVDPRVKGTLTLVSEGQVPARQAYDMLLAALRMQGFSVVDVGGVAQVVPEADAKLLGGPIYSADKPAGNGMLTRTFRLQYENAVNLIPVLRPIVSPNNPINAYPGNNTIVITDYAENLTRVAQLIASIDSPSAIDTDVVQIQNGIAADIAPMVADLLDAPGNDPTQKIAVIGDPRSNTIIIRAGSPERTELARNLIYKLDNAQSNPSNLHVVYLRNAQAAKLAQACVVCSPARATAAPATVRVRCSVRWAAAPVAALGRMARVARKPAARHRPLIAAAARVAVTRRAAVAAPVAAVIRRANRTSPSVPAA